MGDVCLRAELHGWVVFDGAPIGAVRPGPIIPRVQYSILNLHQAIGDNYRPVLVRIVRASVHPLNCPDI